MKTMLLICVIGALFGFPLYAAYWRLFRPVLLQRLKYQLFEARDRLRMLALTGVARKDKAYPILEMMCGKAIGRLDHVDLADLMLFVPDKNTQLEIERDLQTIEAAGVEIRQVFKTIHSALVGSVLANSPGIICLIVPLAFFVLFAYWLDRVKGLIKRLDVRVLSLSYASTI